MYFKEINVNIASLYDALIKYSHSQTNKEVLRNILDLFAIKGKKGGDIA